VVEIKNGKIIDLNDFFLGNLDSTSSSRRCENGFVVLTKEMLLTMQATSANVNEGAVVTDDLSAFESSHTKAV
jgi:hypothetical protein